MQSKAVLSTNAGLTKALLVCGRAAGRCSPSPGSWKGPHALTIIPCAIPISSLSIGDSGWMQIAIFIITGVLTLVFAIGLWHVLRPSGAVWGPGLVGLVGIGLMGAGLFVTDPLNGYPLGTPLIPTERTTHGILHDLFGVPFFLGLPITGLVFARHFARRRPACVGSLLGY
jgi:uncharacterized protein DUF998